MTVSAPCALTAMLPAVGALIHPEVIFQHSPYLEEDVSSKDFLWSSRRVSPVHVEVVGGLQLPGRACHVDSVSGDNRWVGVRKKLLHIHKWLHDTNTFSERHTPLHPITPTAVHFIRSHAQDHSLALILPSVHGRRAVTVRCLHHWMLFEDTMAVGSFLDRYRTHVEEVGSVCVYMCVCMCTVCVCVEGSGWVCVMHPRVLVCM